MEFLPPYSPDFNPIELAFSAIKSRFRRDKDLLLHLMTEAMGDTDRDYQVINKICDMVFSISPSDASGWYHACHYV